jgi:hypothetical protein
MSLLESGANLIVGYGVAVVTQILIFTVFGLHTTLAQNLKMGLVFTVVSRDPMSCGGCSRDCGSLISGGRCGPSAGSLRR